MLTVKNLRLGFTAGRQTLAAVDGISFAISKGETFALLGESGCGKSVTAQGIMRLLPAAGRVLTGSVQLDGEELLALPEADMRRIRGGRMAMIFQEPATSLNPVLTVAGRSAKCWSAIAICGAKQRPSACSNCCARSVSPTRSGASASIPSSCPAA